MHADPEVMADLGGPINFAESKAKFERYREALRQHGTSRWAVETPDGAFLGYAGVMPRLSPEHPIGPHHEIGWRFVRHAWGHGYATESAKAALDHALNVVGLTEIISYTSVENLRSQAVMRKIGLVRSPARDFVQKTSDGRAWRGLVWAMDTRPLRVTAPSLQTTH
jgi:RimJ/RimL family protein N-acetyltransferase